MDESWRARTGISVRRKETSKIKCHLNDKNENLMHQKLPKMSTYVKAMEVKSQNNREYKAPNGHLLPPNVTSLAGNRMHLIELLDNGTLQES